jgi:DNA-binding transcriptional MerR regulator
VRPFSVTGRFRTRAERLWLIQNFLAAGLSSTSIRAVLPSVDDGTAKPEVLATLRAERDRVTRQLDALAAVRGRLDTIIAGATGGCESPRSSRATGPVAADERVR